MEYRLLGNTGVKVSSLCFGTMSFGDEADETASAEMFNHCREVGVNFFDTADAYGMGRSEEILGGLIQDCRDDIILASKVCGPVGTGPNDYGLSRRHIMMAVEDSLRRLKTDRLDLYYAHAFDPSADMELVLRAFEDLVRQGKILYPAVSNWAAWQIAKALGISTHKDLACIECIQPMYNLVKRQAEVELLPLAETERMAVVPYSPLGGGLLTGKYNAGQKPEAGRLIRLAHYSQRYSLSEYYETAERFTSHAQERGVKPASLAVAWVMSHPAVTAPIVGARNLTQLEDSLAALDIKMSPEWRDEISALSVPPASATDRLEENIKNV